MNRVNAQRLARIARLNLAHHLRVIEVYKRDHQGYIDPREFETDLRNLNELTGTLQREVVRAAHALKLATQPA